MLHAVAAAVSSFLSVCGATRGDCEWRCLLGRRLVGSVCSNTWRRCPLQHSSLPPTPHLRPRLGLRSDMGGHRRTHVWTTRPPYWLVGAHIPYQPKLLPSHNVLPVPRRDGIERSHLGRDAAVASARRPASGANHLPRGRDERQPRGPRPYLLLRWHHHSPRRPAGHGRHHPLRVHRVPVLVQRRPAL